MKLLYTDIRTFLTEILTREAEELVATGKRVFYIAPNSLSFEKERAVLECLSQQASFAITVTRFAQMARYLVLNALPNLILRIYVFMELSSRILNLSSS